MTHSKSELRFLLILAMAISASSALRAQEVIDSSINNLWGGKANTFIDLFRQRYPEQSNAKLRMLRQPRSHSICGEFSSGQDGAWRPFCLISWGNMTF